MDLDVFPSNVQTNIISFLANKHDVDWFVMLQYRESSKLFGKDVLKQLVTAKIDEDDYGYILRQRCHTGNVFRAATLTTNFFMQFLPKISHCLNSLYLTGRVMHKAAQSNLTVGPLNTVEMMHMVICSEKSFDFVDRLSNATPAVKKIIFEYPKRKLACSKCAPHEINRFWDANHWNPLQIEKIAFVGFKPDVTPLDLEMQEEEEDDDAHPIFCCEAGALGNMLDDRLYECHNLTALDLRYSNLYDISLKSLGTNFPFLRELRLGFDVDSDAIGSAILGQVSSCSNLQFLEILPDHPDKEPIDLDDSYFIDQLQNLTQLIHLHVSLADCNRTAFAAFFRKADINLKRVYITLECDDAPLVKDIIEGNPELQILVVQISLFNGPFDLDPIFAGLQNLTELNVLFCDITRDRKDHSNAPTFLNLLDPDVHTNLEVAALDLNYGICADNEDTSTPPPPGYTTLIDQAQKRFDGRIVNGKAIEILGDPHVPPNSNSLSRMRILDNFPQAACCVERLVDPQQEDFQWHFPWKNP